MNILNIAGYKFININELVSIREEMLSILENLCLKGTILVSGEGINISLAGNEADVRSFQQWLAQSLLFSNMRFHESYSDKIPFKFLKVKIKQEIITMRQDGVDVNAKSAPSISPATLKQWLDENHDFTLLDTRNDFEVQMGTFKNAVNLHIKDFGEFADCLNKIDRHKPIVMFCTGGIRCEKAAIYLENNGYENVYQLDGGILGYFAQVGGDHYEGSCFVFDDRIAVDAELKQVS